jgi:hypothetical protein
MSTAIRTEITSISALSALTVAVASVQALCNLVFVLKPGTGRMFVHDCEEGDMAMTSTDSGCCRRCCAGMKVTWP